MTTTEFEAYKVEIANEILSVTKLKVLNTIKGILKDARPIEVKVKPTENKTKTEDVLVPAFPPIIPQITAPCCYTLEEIRIHIADAIKSYQQGEYLADGKYKKPALRWTKKACEDSNSIHKYLEIISVRAHSWKFTALVDGAVEIVAFNPKAGRKDPLLADIDSNIRSLVFGKNNKLFYVDMPDCILILAIQYSLTPFDTRLHKRKK